MFSEEVSPFREEAAEVLRRLRTAFAAIVSALPGAANKGADLQRTLKIDMKLGWKISRIVNAADPLTEGHNVPGRSNMKSFLKAAKSRGVAQDLLVEAAEAAESFEQFVAAQAGDRAAFDSMISDLAGAEASVQMHIRHKRAAFRANRHIWGVQAKAQVRCLIIQPSPDPNMVSMAVLQGYQELCRLRSDTPLVISGLRIRNDDNSIRQTNYEPLAPGQSSDHGIALIPEFCSKPLPRFRTVEGEGGFVHGQLLGMGVGAKSAVNCVHGHVLHKAFTRYREENNHLLKLSIRVRIPCESLIHDLLIRDDTFGSITPQAAMFGDDLFNSLRHKPVDAGDDAVLHENVAYLGKGTSVLHTPKVPRYTSMANYAFDSLGWDRDRFSAYRCEVEHPAMGGIVRIWLEFPERPQE